MDVATLLKLLKLYPKKGIIAPKIYAAGDGITLEVYTIGEIIKREGGIDVPFQVIKSRTK